MASPLAPPSSTSTSLFDDDYDTLTPMAPQFTLIKDHPNHPFGSRQPPRQITFNFTPKTTAIQLTASITQYDTQTHIHLTETGMFTTHLRITMDPASSSSSSTSGGLDSIDNYDPYADSSPLPPPPSISNLLIVEPLQGLTFFVTEMLCRKIAEPIITPETPVIFSIALTNVLGLKSLVKGGNNGNQDVDCDLSDEQIIIMKDVVREFHQRMVLE